MVAQKNTLTVLHNKAMNLGSITNTITSFISDKTWENSSLVGQGYDGAATFSVVQIGVQEKDKNECCTCA